MGFQPTQISAVSSDRARRDRSNAVEQPQHCDLVKALRDDGPLLVGCRLGRAARRAPRRPAKGARAPIAVNGHPACSAVRAVAGSAAL